MTAIDSDKCLKCPISGDRLTSNMVNVPKHCWNLYRSAFMIFIDNFQGNWDGKSLSYWHAKSWDCLLQHWLSRKSILFLIETLEQYQFRCTYLQNKKIFLNFFLLFENLHEVLIFLSKKMALIDFVFSKLRTLKT